MKIKSKENVITTTTYELELNAQELQILQFVLGKTSEMDIETKRLDYKTFLDMYYSVIEKVKAYEMKNR